MATLKERVIRRYYWDYIARGFSPGLAGELARIRYQERFEKGDNHASQK